MTSEAPSEPSYFEIEEANLRGADLREADLRGTKVDSNDETVNTAKTTHKSASVHSVHPETLDAIVNPIMDECRRIIEYRIRKALADQYNAGYEDRALDDEFTNALKEQIKNPEGKE